MKNPKTMIADKFNGSRRMRSYRNTHFGAMDAVTAHPMAMVRFRPDEGGTVMTNLSGRLAPVNGYMRSKAYLDVVQVFVPYQAMEVLEMPLQEDAGVTEMARRRLLAGQGIGLEDENTISRACNIHPRAVGADRRVSKTIRLAYLAAVNHLRKSAYYNATLVDNTETAILPAILSANVLERFNGVLDPEPNVDGAINLTGQLPVRGIGYADGVQGVHSGVRTPDNNTPHNVHGIKAGDTHGAGSIVIATDTVSGRPLVQLDMSGTGEITLRDMVKSKKLDELVREFAGLIKRDPINGEELVERALYNISVDYDHNCQVLSQETLELAPQHIRPMDGASVNEITGHFEFNYSRATVVPRSELGGQFVTIVALKPVETITAQPDPAQTEAWALVNRVHDELELDEQLLVRSDLESDLAPADQDTPAFWVGHNALKHAYATQGPNEQQTFGVEMKSSMWTYEVPTSLTPENISYPSGGIDMYPFANWSGGHFEATIDQRAAISTPLAKGPNPVERIQLFADDPSLVEEQ